MSIKDIITQFTKTLAAVHKSAASDKLAFELKERENSFSLLCFGMLAGVPTPCPFLTLQLLPLMERELIMLLNSAHDSNDMLATLASHFDGL